MFVCVCKDSSWDADNHGHHRTTWKSWFPISTMQTPGIKFMSSGLKASAFTNKPTGPALQLCVHILPNFPSHSDFLKLHPPLKYHVPLQSSANPPMLHTSIEVHIQCSLLISYDHSPIWLGELDIKHCFSHTQLIFQYLQWKISNSNNQLSLMVHINQPISD